MYSCQVLINSARQNMHFYWACLYMYSCQVLINSARQNMHFYWACLYSCQVLINSARHVDSYKLRVRLLSQTGECTSYSNHYELQLANIDRAIMTLAIGPMPELVVEPGMAYLLPNGV